MAYLKQNWVYFFDAFVLFYTTKLQEFFAVDK